MIAALFILYLYGAGAFVAYTLYGEPDDKAARWTTALTWFLLPIFILAGSIGPDDDDGSNSGV